MCAMTITILFLHIILTTIYLIWLDWIWLWWIMKSMYHRYLWYLMLDQIHLWYGAIVWIIMAIVYVLLLKYLPIYHRTHSVMWGMLIWGWLYAVYNFTNLAILKDYPRQIAIIDTSRGLIQWALVGLWLRFIIK